MSKAMNSGKRANAAMKKIMFAAILLGIGAVPASSPSWAASQADFNAAYAAADAANKEAGRLRNQWTTTTSALAAAKKAADAGNFDQGVTSAREAEALAKASIFQATSEKQRWKDMEIR